MTDQDKQYRPDQLEMMYLLCNLSNFPHIAKRVEVTWGDPACRKYLYSLTVNDTTRDRRQGFPFDVLTTIVELLELHDTVFPQFSPIIKSWEQSMF